MPREFGLLKNEPNPAEFCPHCSSAFEPFMRGLVQSAWRRWLGLPYCSVICYACKDIVGHERPWKVSLHRSLQLDGGTF